MSLAEEFEAAKADGRALYEGLLEDGFRWRPSPKAWSMAECLDHLNVVGRKYLRGIDAAIDAGHAKGARGDGSIRYGLMERFLVRSMDAPPLFHMKTPRSFVPAASASVHDGLRAFLELQDEFRQRLARAADLDLSRVKVRSPVSRHLKLTLAAAFAMIAAHQRRHLWQARQVKTQPRFPG
jgi:hypothetical protein